MALSDLQPSPSSKYIATIGKSTSSKTSRRPLLLVTSSFSYGRPRSAQPLWNSTRETRGGCHAKYIHKCRGELPQEVMKAWILVLHLEMRTSRSKCLCPIYNG